MPEPSLSAEALIAAVDRIHGPRTFPRPVTVVKLGGSAMEDPAATDACLRCVATLHKLHRPVALVHGGGKPIDRAMAAAGLSPKKVAGRRYTDAATLEIVVRVLSEINRDLCRRLEALGVNATSYTDEGWFPLWGQPLTLPGAGDDDPPIDLGLVGYVDEVRLDPFDDDFGAEFNVAVVPSLARHPGGWLNVNADTAASAVAGALEAERAVFLTDTPGVLRDRANPGSLIPRLTEAEARELIRAGVIDGGMVPKVEACFEALVAGAKAALILDGRVPFALLDVFLRDTFTGTAITR